MWVSKIRAKVSFIVVLSEVSWVFFKAGDVDF